MAQQNVARSCGDGRLSEATLSEVEGFKPIAAR